MKNPLILVTNDDGVDSPGLHAAARAASKVGEVLVVSTRDPQTAMGRSYPKQPDIGKIADYLLRDENGLRIKAYSVVASPAQAVSYAILELAPRQPDICLSGINFGENLGTTLTGSGTIGAAFEADSYNIPSLAVSLQVDPLDEPNSTDWSKAEFFTERLLWQLSRERLPTGISILNVNVPKHAKLDTELRVTIDSRQPYFVFRKPNRVSNDLPVRLPVTVEFDASVLEKNSDIQAVIIDRVVSITPLSSTLASSVAWKPR